MAYVCNMCNLVVESISGLCTHIRFLHPHNILSVYKCCHCSREYSTLKYLRDHLNKKHPEKDCGGNQPNNRNEQDLDDNQDIAMEVNND